MAGQNDLRVVGAGLGRTGTKSLQLRPATTAGRTLLSHGGGVRAPRAHPYLGGEARSAEPNLDEILDGYVATVDWPGVAFWRELAAANAGAVILLSTRSNAETWWRSADKTIFDGVRHAVPPPEFLEMWRQLTRRGFTDRLDHDSAVEAYARHNADVRATADPRRLVEWQPGDGWQPLCTALEVAVPEEPFPHANTTESSSAAAPTGPLVGSRSHVRGRFRKRKRDANDGALAGAGGQLEGSTGQVHTLDRGIESEVVAHRGAIERLGQLEADPVVAHRRPQLTARLDHDDVEPAGAGMLAGVGDHLLDGAVDEVFDAEP